MNRNSVTYFVLGSIAFLTASCSPDTLLETNNEDQELQTYTLYLDADVPSFESGHKGETRASGSSWEDGDVIYISFSKLGRTIVGKATYKSSLEAFKFASVSLNTINDANCSVYYFRGGSVSEEGNTINIDKHTAIFCDTSAKYTFSNNTIFLSASLKPHTWRLCFKGKKGTQVKLQSSSAIIYYSSLDLTTGYFTSMIDDADLQVQSSGYTPYIYGRFSGNNNLMQIKVSNNYAQSIPTVSLAIGESGYFSIPTSDNLCGWKLTSYTNVINSHEYVDLGLPSGTKWATCNIGAISPEEYGGYYAWGETEEKDIYNDVTYLYSSGTDTNGDGFYDDDISYQNIGDNIAGSKYDVAHVKWGDPWHMPSSEQIIELIDNCTWTNTTFNGVNGTLYTGPYGSTIFLPAAGYVGPNGKNTENGFYWASTLSTDWNLYAAALYFYSIYTICQGVFRFNGLPVRAAWDSSLPLTLSQTNINLTVGQSTIIEITNGSGNYSISSNNSDIVNASLSGTSIFIEAIHSGFAAITVEDYGMGREVIICIRVIGHANPEYPIAEAIDLGLPSGTKWASWNIGASFPEEYGGYYAWGETEEKYYYDWSTYNHCDGSEETCHNLGNDIANTIYDVAHLKWGGSWCMPSRIQFAELIDNCTKTWTTQNGVQGTLFIGPNGNTLFLPAAGSRFDDRLHNDGIYGCYWTSSKYGGSKGSAWDAYFNYEVNYLTDGARCVGEPIRAVCQ